MKKEKLVFQSESVKELRDQLQQSLPSHVVVKEVNDVRPPRISIRDGSYRGATLILDNSSQQVCLTRIVYDIPSLLTKFMIFIAAGMVWSTIIMLIDYKAHIAPSPTTIFFPVCAASAAMYVIFKTILVRFTKGDWSAELSQAIEGLKEQKS